MRQIIVVLMSLFLMAADTNKITLHAVEMKPFIYDPYSGYSGALLGITQDAFKRANIPLSVEYHTNWDDAMQQPLLYRHAAFAADVVNEAKKYSYQTVNTYFKITYVVVAHKDNLISFDDVDDLLKHKVAVVKDRLTGNSDFDSKYLSDKGDFKQVLSVGHALTEVYSGRVDVAVIPKETADILLSGEYRYESRKITEIGVINQEYLHIIFNKNTPKQTINSLQQAFDDLSKDIRIYGYGKL